MKIQAGLNHPLSHQFIGKMPEHRPELIEALIAKKRPELYQVYKEHGVSITGKDFMDGYRQGKEAIN